MKVTLGLFFVALKGIIHDCIAHEDIQPHKANPFTNSTVSLCSNLEGWKDGLNDRNCTWFEEEEVQGCPLFGNYSMDANNVTALTACCWCGGGDIAIHDMNKNDKVDESLRITERSVKYYYVLKMLHAVKLLLMLEQNIIFYHQFTDMIWPCLIYHPTHHPTHHLHHQLLSALI